MSVGTEIFTTEQLLAFPEDGKERDLIRGELREREMTRRNRFHAATEARVARYLGNWAAEHPELGLDVLAGEVGVVLERDPDTTFGIDAVVFSVEVLRGHQIGSLVNGVPLLAVEIVSPSDKAEDLHEKIGHFLRLNVTMVWEVDPAFQTVRMHRPGQGPSMVNRFQMLSGADVLPGFEVPVKDLFPDW